MAGELAVDSLPAGKEEGQLQEKVGETLSSKEDLDEKVTKTCILSFSQRGMNF